MNRRWGFFFVFFVMVSCAPHKPPIVINKLPEAGKSTGLQKQPASQASLHIVSRGETLYSIAWGIGLDFYTLAKWNSIVDPYTIYPGQVIRLTAPRVIEQSDTRATSSIKPSQGASPNPDSLPRQQAATGNGGAVSSSVQTPGTAAPKTDNGQKDQPVGRWRWPSSGKVIERYQPSSGVNGIRISDKAGSPVTAAAEGKVGDEHHYERGRDPSADWCIFDGIDDQG